MKQNSRLVLLFPVLVVVLLAAAALPLGALAQDSTPPPPDGTVANPLEPAGIDSTPTPTATPGAPTTEAAPTAAPDEPISQPADTNIVVLDSAGEEVPLASTEAAEIIAVGDPIWCPDGVAPVAGAGGCTISYLTLEALLAALSGAQPSQNGTIWILSGADASLAPITFDGAVLTTWNDYALTFQGGWDNSSAGTIVGQTTFSVPLKIVSWANDISLNNLVFDSTVSDGLYVTTSGDIELENVESKENSGRGAYLNNTSGGTTARVTVSESSFHDNNLAGIDIYTLGDVSLTYVDASFNLSAGAQVFNSQTVSITGSNFNWNDADGLGVNASEDISLSDVDARHNSGLGAWLIAGDDISVVDANFDQNGGPGLLAFAGHMNSLTAVNARENGASGLILDAGRDATLAQVNASANGGSGADVWADWNILVDFSTLNDNDQDGVKADSNYGDITVSCSSFSGNNGYGVNADRDPLLELNSDTFSGNGLGDYAVTGTGVIVGGDDPDCSDEPEVKPTPTATPGTLSTMNVVHVVSGQVVTLDCVAYRGTVLVLSSRDQVVFPCPILGQASLAFVEGDELPGELDTGFTFVSGMEARVRPSLDGIIRVDFYLLPGQTDTDLSILRWDDTSWTNLRGVRTEEDFFEALSSQDGIFVLVSE